MAKKTTKDIRTSIAKEVKPPAVDRFEEAAAKAGVSVEEFRLWALRSLRGVNPKQWSHWETGFRPIPDRIIIQFLRQRSERASPGTARPAG